MNPRSRMRCAQRSGSGSQGPRFNPTDRCQNRTAFSLVVRFINTVTQGRRGARPARREEEEYLEYLTDEQRRGTDAFGGRMPPYSRPAWARRDGAVEQHDRLLPAAYCDAAMKSARLGRIDDIQI